MELEKLRLMNNGMGEGLQLIAFSEIYFDNKQLVPIDIAIKSLQGLQGALRYVPKLLTELTNVEIKSFEIYATDITASSWLTQLAFILNFENEEELLKARKKFAQDHPMLNRTVTTVALVVIAGAMLYSAIGSKGTTISGDTIHIEGSNNQIIKTGAVTLNVEPEAIEKALSKIVQNKHEFAVDGSKLAAPAKFEKGVSISVRGDNLKVEFPPEVISDVPETYIKPPPDHREEHIRNARVNIRAIDLDNLNKGWAGYLDGIDRRLPISLDPSVPVDELHGEIYADVILQFKFDGRANKLLPSEIHIKQLGDSNKPIGSLGPHQKPTDNSDDIQGSIF